MKLASMKCTQVGSYDFWPEGTEKPMTRAYHVETPYAEYDIWYWDGAWAGTKIQGGKWLDLEEKEAEAAAMLYSREALRILGESEEAERRYVEVEVV